MSKILHNVDLVNYLTEMSSLIEVLKTTSESEEFHKIQVAALLDIANSLRVIMYAIVESGEKYVNFG